MACVTYLWILIVSVHMSRFEKVDLEDIFIHKWVPMHRIYFILGPDAAGPPSPAEHWNLAMGPKVN